MLLIVPDFGLEYKIKKVDNVYSAASFLDERSGEFNVIIDGEITTDLGIELIGSSARIEIGEAIGTTGIIQRLTWSDSGVEVTIEWP